mmetsp:Transcript_101579/g.171991  ORF Transcript_101579/g.171991 Transcript_101579/m.171991 type:complete len:85 (+) Transcript_101579:1315-1569(+)
MYIILCLPFSSFFFLQAHSCTSDPPCPSGPPSVPPALLLQIWHLPCHTTPSTVVWHIPCVVLIRGPSLIYAAWCGVVWCTSSET